jgi:methylisocitrate lyase
MAEKKGHKALYLSGGGVAISSLGVPDLGITTLEDVAIDARRITRACPDTPLLVDIDTGFGTTIFNVRRTVQDLELMGVAGVHMEDQVVAKRCGHRPNKSIVSTEEMVHRITAAIDGRQDPSFLIMARTDALATEGLEASIERCKKYVEAGADALFVEAVTELDQYRAFAKALPGVPLLANLTEFGKTPLFSLPELASVDVSMALYPLSAFRAMSKAADTVFETLKKEGSCVPCMDVLHTREQTYAVIDYHKHEQMLDKFQSSE